MLITITLKFLTSKNDIVKQETRNYFHTYLNLYFLITIED
jgi:hypothetical protein